MKEKLEVNAIEYFIQKSSGTTIIIILIIFLMFFAPLFMGSFTINTQIPFDFFFFAYLVTSIAISIYYYISLKLKGFKVKSYFLIPFGFIPMIGGINSFIVFTNNIFAGDEVTNEYKITYSMSRSNRDGESYPVFLYMKNNQRPEIRFSPKYHKDILDYKKIILTTKKGFWGFEILCDKEAIK